MTSAIIKKISLSDVPRTHIQNGWSLVRFQIAPAKYGVYGRGRRVLIQSSLCVRHAFKIEYILRHLETSLLVLSFLLSLA